MNDFDRCQQLLADRATNDLSDVRRHELNTLLGTHPEWEDEALELTAATLDLLVHQELEVMPDTVRLRLERQAHSWPLEESVAYELPPHRAADLFLEPSAIPASPRRGRSWVWWATAAALAVAVSGWWTVLRPTGVDPVQLREQLLTQTADTVRLPWTATADPAAEAAAGDVVWSASEQQGYLRITGLETNDPNVAQYQLWVFDRERDERYPVDGGVFDIASGEVVVPIRLAIPVTDASLFAVTVEKPGGVVVSDRERIVLTAAAGG